MKVIIVLLFIFSLNVFAGDCSKDEAKTKVEEACKMVNEKGEKAFGDVRNIKFCGQNYVWINTIRKNDGDLIIMKVHRAKRRLEGKDVAGVKDPDGVALFVEFDKKVKSKEKEGWVDYKWTKPGEEKATDKTSFVKDCGGFLVGAGVWK